MYDNTFAAGRARYKNRFYFSVFMTLNFIHFTPRGTCIFILLNKTNGCFILFLYCHQLISFEDKTKQLYQVSNVEKTCCQKNEFTRNLRNRIQYIKRMLSPRE